jgi:hypothetical protein
MEAVDFHMPNALYVLPKANPIEAATAHDPDTTRFMIGDVVPAMKALLAEEVSCSACHRTE